MNEEFQVAEPISQILDDFKQARATNSAIHETSLYTLVGGAALAARQLQDIIDATEMQQNEQDQLIARIVAQLNEYKEAMPKKIENWVNFIRSLEGCNEIIRNEEKRLAEKRQRGENLITKLKDGLKSCLLTLEDHKLRWATGSAAIHHRQGAALKITDEQMLPADLRFWKIEKTFKKNEAKNALKAGEKIGGCELVDQDVLVIR